MANKIYVAQETAHTWTDTGGDETLDLGSVGGSAGNARQGDQWDRGASSIPQLFRWQILIDGFDTAPVVGETVDVYLGFSDGTNNDGGIGIADADLSLSALPNLMFLGSVIVQTTTPSDKLITSGTVLIEARYVTPAVHNNTVDKLLSTADAHKFILTPVPPEIQ